MEFQGVGRVRPARQVSGISFQGVLLVGEESGGTFGAEGMCELRGHRREFGYARQE